MTMVKIPAPHLLVSDLQQVTNHIVPQFCHLLNGDDSASYLKGLVQELSDLFGGYNSNHHSSVLSSTTALRIQQNFEVLRHH